MRSEDNFRGPVALVSLVGGLLALVALLWVSALGGEGLSIASFGAEHMAAPEALGVGSANAASLRVDHTSRRALGLADPAAITGFICTLEITTTDRAPFGNHTLGTAASIANYTDQALVVGNQGEEKETEPDFYRLDNASIGHRYTVQAKPDRTLNYNLGIIVYDHEGVAIITDTNVFDNNFASVTLTAENHGPYFFEVRQISEQCSGHTYSLILSFTAPTSTPSPTTTPTGAPTTASPQPTWMAGFDQYEPNWNFERATTIAPGISYQLNFIPWGGAEVDNDFLKVRVKPGLQLTCETSDLDPGVDPRMVFYRGPGEEHFIMANDDIALGNFNSRLTYYADYEGYVYILVGQGQRMSKLDTVNSDYTVTCSLGVPERLTPVPGYTPGDKGVQPTLRVTTVVPTTGPTATPTSPTSPVGTPTPPTSVAGVELTFRLVASPAPVTATPAPGGSRTFRVLVYYDEDLDGQLGAGEGIPGFFVMVVSPDGRRELAQGYTDEQGQLSFTVPTVGTVRVLVPLLGFDRLIEASRPEVKVRIVPPSLPEAIP